MTKSKSSLKATDPMESGELSPLFLYVLCTLIWGSTWIVLRFQVDTVSPVIGVFYRFVLASGILFAFAKLRGTKLKWTGEHHRNFMFQGIANFSFNYMMTYYAGTLTTSGLLALTFTVLIYFNMFGMRIFFGRKIGWNVIVGSLLGGCGLVVVFLNELLSFHANADSLKGLAIGVGATLFASIGNLFAYRNHLRGVPVVAGNAWGMLYGTLMTGMIAVFTQQQFFFAVTPKFVFAFLYLTIFGTVIAFGAYMSLSGRIGADRAAYTSVMSPVLALGLSAIFENLQWTWFLTLGLALCLAGNILTLAPVRARK